MPLTLNGTTGIVTANLADASVTTAKIADSAVATVDIANGAVTAAKLSGAQTGTAPVYGCRAWVVFDGTRDSSAVASTANTARFLYNSANVTSVVRNTAGSYTVNFTTAMPSSSYAALVTTIDPTGGSSGNANGYTTTSLTIGTIRISPLGMLDMSAISVAIFG